MAAIEVHAYFDAAGESGQHPALAIAGFVSTLERWRDFEVRWKAELEARRLPYSHMKRLSHFKPPFDGMGGDEKAKEEARASFIECLAKLTCNAVEFCVTSAMILKDYDELQEIVQQRNPKFTTAGTAALNMLRAIMEEKHKGAALTLVFESGDYGLGMLKERAKQIFSDWPGLTLADARRHERTPLQTADLMAYELAKYLKDHQLGNSGRPVRKSLKAMESIECYGQLFGRASFEGDIRRALLQHHWRRFTSDLD